MAQAKKDNFPKLPAKHWWLLRKKFKSSIPSTITPGYVAAALNMKESSAKANVLPALVKLGIVDDQFKPKDRAYDWRDDKKYSKVCSEILEDIYPEELRSALPGPVPNKDSVKSWFASRMKVGENAALKMAIMYETLCEADYKKGEEFLNNLKNDNNSKSTKSQSVTVKKTNKEKNKPNKISKTDTQSNVELNTEFSPSVHIDLQIHISPDANPEQIDKIFASMSKHIFNRKVVSNEN